MLGEQVEMFENDAELEKHFDKYGEMLQANDPDCMGSKMMGSKITRYQ